MFNTKQKFNITTDHDKFVLEGRTCEISEFAHVPPNPTATFDRTCYNVPKDFNVRTPLSTYDRLFIHGITQGYNQKLHRCDREFAKLQGLRTNQEECQKIVPTLFSSRYGHPLREPYDHSGRDHVRINLIKKEFYRNNGPNLKPEDDTVH